MWLGKVDMSDLLEQAIAAHGGLDAWRGMTSCVARLSIDGAIWRMKGVPDVFRSVGIGRARIHRI